MKEVFWKLERPYYTTHAKSLGDWGSITCPVDPDHMRGRSPKLGELSVELPLRPLSDFEWTWTSDMFISERALRVLRENKVTGFETRAVTATYPDGITAKPPMLHRLVVTGWGGMAAAAGITVADFCASCGHKAYRIANPSRLIDPLMWDGGDLFIVWPLPLYRFASNRLADIIRRNYLSGVDLVLASQISMKPGACAAPRSLTRHMPEDRALEIAKTFDVL